MSTDTKRLGGLDVYIYRSGVLNVYRYNKAQMSWMSAGTESEVLDVYRYQKRF